MLQWLRNHISCLSQYVIAVKRYYDHSNFYKGTHLIRADSQFRRFNFIVFMEGSMVVSRQACAEELTESSTSG